MWSLADELVDLDKLYTSDIYAILQTYGVEACRTAIINEMAAVFGVYGIKVDYRHRTVIADYMVCNSSYSSMCPALTRSLSDACRVVPCIQPYRHRTQAFASAQGFVRNDSQILG